MFSEIHTRLRQRRLGGDARAGSWARSEARRLQWAFVRRQWPHLAAILVVVVVTTGIALFFVPGAFQRGFILGSVIVGTLFALSLLVMQVTGTAPMSMGAAAEQWTASELRPLRKRGWRVVNHFSLRAHRDIDHVLIGSPGIVAVETKWSARDWSLDPPDERVLAAAHQVRSNAKDLSLWHPLRSLGVRTVKPVLFLWGGRAPRDRDQPVLFAVGDVAVVAGSSGAQEWRAQMEELPAQQGFGIEHVEALWRAIDAHARRRDARDATDAPAPPTLLRLYVSAIAVVTSGLAGFLVGLQTLPWLGSWWLWGVTCLVLIALGAFSRQLPQLRLVAVAWLTGLGAAIFLVISVAAYSALT